MTHSEIAIIKGDDIGLDVTDATPAVVDAERNVTDGFSLKYHQIEAGAGYFAETGSDQQLGALLRISTLHQAAIACNEITADYLLNSNLLEQLDEHKSIVRRGQPP